MSHHNNQSWLTNASNRELGLAELSIYVMHYQLGCTLLNNGPHISPKL